LKIYNLCSQAWDYGDWNVWGFTLDEEKAKEWVRLVQEQDDRWNGSNFDKEIDLDHRKELTKLGIRDKETLEYDGSHAGNAYYEEVDEIEMTRLAKPNQPSGKNKI